jgi:ribose transport system substrate-binding protein
MLAWRPSRKMLTAIVLIATLVTACTPAAGTAQPATQAATLQPATQAATQPAAPERHYAVVPPVVHPFYGPFPGAIADATKDFSLGTVEYQLPQNFVQNEQNQIIDGLVAKGYNAFAIQPADPVAGNAKIGELVDAGMLVVTFGGCPTPPSKAPFCLATDVKQAAYLGATKLIEEMGGKGNLVHLTGEVADINSKRRMEGVEQAISEHPDVKLLQTIGDIDTPEKAPNAVASLLAASHDQIDGILATAYNPAVAVANEFRKTNETRIKAIGIDTDKIVLDAIRDGFTTGTIAQNPYGMAYLSLYSLELMSKGYTWKSPDTFFMDSGAFYVNKSSVDNLDAAAKELNQKLKDAWINNWNPPTQ